MEYFKRTYSVVEWSLEGSTSNEGTSCLRNLKEEASSSGIFERIKGGEMSTWRRTIKESSSNEEDKVFLKASYKEDIVKAIKPSYKHLFKISTKLIK